VVLNWFGARHHWRVTSFLVGAPWSGGLICLGISIEKISKSLKNIAPSFAKNETDDLRRRGITPLLASRSHLTQSIVVNIIIFYERTTSNPHLQWHLEQSAAGPTTLAVVSLYAKSQRTNDGFI